MKMCIVLLIPLTEFHAKFMGLIDRCVCACVCVCVAWLMSDLLVS